MAPRWLVRSAVVVVAVLLFGFAARELPILAVLAAIGGALAGLGYLVTRIREMPARSAGEERSKRDRVLRDSPPPPIA